MKRWLILLHRWLGLAGCVLIVTWFATGFVMMYVPYPELLGSERLARAAPIQTEQVRVTPAAALRVARAGAAPQSQTERLRLIQVGPKAVYSARLAQEGWVGVDAASGERLRVDAALAASAGARFAGVPALHAEPVEPDQWSMQSYFDAHRPLWAVQVTDGGVHYLSGRSGEMLRDTSRSERAWNWVGSVVHWVYPTVLRRDARLWHWVVVVLSSYALAVALLGTVIGLLRWRWRDRGRRSPYAGWLRWHHLLGLACALFTIAWLTSGLLSMNPGDVFSERSPSVAETRAWRGASLDEAALHGALDLALPPAGAGQGAAVEFEWWPDGDTPGAAAGVRVAAVDASGARRLWRWKADSAAWSVHAVDQAQIARRVERLLAGSHAARSSVTSMERLHGEDLYHYGRFEPAPPIWRVRLGDAAATWLHVDARSGELLARIDRGNRVRRLAYHGLHSWDFAFLLEHRPLWDLLMLPALASGFLFSVTSVVVAAQRLAAMLRRGRSRSGTFAHTPSGALK